MNLRPYQQEAVNAVYDHLRTRDDNPCVVGKTPVMATICRDAVTHWNGRVLVLAHVKELLEQAVDRLYTMAPDRYAAEAVGATAPMQDSRRCGSTNCPSGTDIGVYSAGLKSRDTEHSIIVAGIQSVYQRACELGPFDLILIDEVHMLPPSGEGRYRTFMADAKVVNPNVRIIGLTATPYRMSTGTICSPDNLLNHVCYEVGVRELIEQGYLCPLKSKASRRKVDTSELHVRGGEFVAGEVESLMNDDTLVRSACQEIVEHTHDRNATLIFAAGINHAKHVQKVLGESDIECGFVCGDTSATERTETLQRFKDGQLKYLVNVNVNVLTTGFDAPNIDCVALLRPTNSPGLYYQMVGRGFRLHPLKENCLVLDFAGNILRHGPVDALQIEDKTSGTGEPPAPAKECPNCLSLIHAAYMTCPDCGHEFPPPEREKHDEHATTEGVLSGEITDNEYDVREVVYSVHTKRGADEYAPKTLRIEYQTGFNQWTSEWVCPEHSGWARQKFEKWWSDRSSYPPPENAQDAVALANDGALAETKAITVRSIAGERFDRVTRYELGAKPDYYPEPGWNDQLDENGLLPSDNWDEIPF